MSQSNRFDTVKLVRIGVARGPFLAVGAFESNLRVAIEQATMMRDQKCCIGVFPELVFSGYLGEELFHYQDFLAQSFSCLMRFADATAVGARDTLFFVGVAVEYMGAVYNCAAAVCNGSVLAIIPKEHTPNYNVFHERRIFSLGKPGMRGTIEASMGRGSIPLGDYIVETPFGRVSVDVCEDIWTPDGPLLRRSLAGAVIHCNISSSPFRIGALETRRQMLATRSADNQAIVVYANRLGSHDGLIFSGDVFVHQNGACLREGQRWAQSVEIQDVDVSRTLMRRRADTTWRLRQEEYLERRAEEVGIVTSHHFFPPNDPSYRYPVPANGRFFLPADSRPRSPLEELFEELEMALMWSLSYFTHSGAFKRIGIALSGGRDSVLSLIIAWRYAKVLLGLDDAGVKEIICCISMPTRFNSDTTKNLAQRAAEELGVTFWEIPIEEEVEMKLGMAMQMLGGGMELDGLVKQNSIARIRADRMMVWSGMYQGMVLNNGNMSEKATGYGTLLGDWSVGAFGLLSNLPKTLIEAFLEYLGNKYGLGFMSDLLATMASAELEEGQTDEGNLMPFAILDSFLYLFALEKMSPADMYLVARSMWTDEQLSEMAPGYEPGMLKVWAKRFINLFSRSIYKWVVAPLGAHVGTLDLDRERAFHIPVVQSAEWLAKSLRTIDNCPD